MWLLSGIDDIIILSYSHLQAFNPHSTFSGFTEHTMYMYTHLWHLQENLISKKQAITLKAEL